MFFCSVVSADAAAAMKASMRPREANQRLAFVNALRVSHHRRLQVLGENAEPFLILLPLSSCSSTARPHEPRHGCHNLLHVTQPPPRSASRFCSHRCRGCRAVSLPFFHDASWLWPLAPHHLPFPRLRSHAPCAWTSSSAPFSCPPLAWFSWPSASASFGAASCRPASRPGRPLPGAAA